MSMPPDLDAEELKFLAIQASRNKQSHQALIYLKEALVRSPRQGDLYYLIGAEHAQLGMYERAADEMEHALALSPQLHMARLQLALLHLSLGRSEAAMRVLQPLEQLGAEHALYQFGQGLQHLLHERFTPCRHALEKGMALNTDNPSLNADIGKLLNALPAEPVRSDLPPGEAPAGNVWLAAYRQDKEKP